MKGIELVENVAWELQESHNLGMIDRLLPWSAGAVLEKSIIYAKRKLNMIHVRKHNRIVHLLFVF